MASRRLFFALWPDAASAERLLAAVPQLGARGRTVAGVDLHLTLSFLGAVDEALLPALCECAAALLTAPFELDLDALEYWPQSRVVVAVSSQVPPAAGALAAALAASAHALGLQLAPERPWRPHVTLVRGATVSTVEIAAAHRLPLSPPLRFAPSRFYLAQSHELVGATATGAQTARYTRLASWPLSRPG